MQDFTSKFKELLIQGPQQLLEEFTPQTAFHPCLANTAHSQLFVMEN